MTDEREREHCERVAYEYYDAKPSNPETWQLPLFILRERAAARREGEAKFEHGRRERDAVLTAYLEFIEKADDVDTMVREYEEQCKVDIAALQSKYDEEYGYLGRLFLSYAPQCALLPDLIGVCTQIDNCMTEIKDLRTLQSKHERVVTAARDVRLEYDAVGIIHESTWLPLDAALADEPSFDQLNQHGFERMIAAADARYLRLATAARAFFDAVCKTDQCIEVGVFAALDAALADSPETVPQEPWRERYEELLEAAGEFVLRGDRDSHNVMVRLLQNQPKGEGGGT